MLNVEEWNKIFEDALKAPDDQASLVSLMTRARDEYVNGYAELTTAEQEREKLKVENDNLKQTNMELFLRIGKQQEQAQDTSNGKDSAKERAESITVENLLKEALENGN